MIYLIRLRLTWESKLRKLWLTGKFTRIEQPAYFLMSEKARNNKWKPFFRKILLTFSKDISILASLEKKLEVMSSNKCDPIAGKGPTSFEHIASCHFFSDIQALQWIQ